MLYVVHSSTYYYVLVWFRCALVKHLSCVVPSGVHTSARVAAEWLLQLALVRLLIRSGKKRGKFGNRRTSSTASLPASQPASHERSKQTRVSRRCFNQPSLTTHIRSFKKCSVELIYRRCSALNTLCSAGEKSLAFRTMRNIQSRKHSVIFKWLHTN